jgi:regulator of protease activity HflC (stomatin/prohibitin superfamily)
MLIAVAGIVALLVLIVGWKCRVVVPDGGAAVVERLGRFHQTLPPGTHFIAPFIDRVRSNRPTLVAQETLAGTAISYDNIPLRVESTFRWKIVDPQKADTAASDLDAFVRGVMQSQQREWVGKRAWADIRETTRELESDVVRAAGDAVSAAGVQILEMTVQRVDRA